MKGRYMVEDGTSRLQGEKLNGQLKGGALLMMTRIPSEGKVKLVGKPSISASVT